MSYNISVIIPVYNVENYIKECLDSLINQSLGINNIEVIIVNDCTPDNSMDIVKDYAKKYPSIKILEQKTNQGPGAARNLGLKHVTSDYVTFLDSDDFISENAYEYCLNLFSENDNTDLVIYKYELFNEEGEVPPPDIHQKIYEKNHIITDLNDVPEVIFATAPWNKIYSKKLIPYLNFPSMLYEDNITSVKTLINSSKVVVTTDSIYYYRFKEGRSSRSQSISKENNEDLIKSIIQLLNFKDNCPKYSKLISYLALKFTYDDIFWMLKLDYSFKDREEIFNNLKVLSNEFSKDILDGFEIEFPEYLLSNENELIDIGKMSAFDYFIKYKFLDECINPLYESNIYIDVGKGFNEFNKISKKYHIDDIIELNFDLKNYDEIKGIRFDPIENHFCTCTILSIKSNKSELNIKGYNSSTPFENKTQTFTTPDPEYKINGDFININYINIKFKIHVLSNIEVGKQFISKDIEINKLNTKLNKAYSDIGEKDRVINEKDSVLIELRDTIKSQNFEIATKDEIISNKNEIIELRDNKIKEITDSTSWKVTKPIRSIKKSFKKEN